MRLKYDQKQRIWQSEEMANQGEPEKRPSDASLHNNKNKIHITLQSCFFFSILLAHMKGKYDHKRRIRQSEERANQGEPKKRLRNILEL